MGALLSRVATLGVTLTQSFVHVNVSVYQSLIIAGALLRLSLLGMNDASPLLANAGVALQ
jgi:hypothetical protein